MTEENFDNVCNINQKNEICPTVTKELIDDNDIKTSFNESSLEKPQSQIVLSKRQMKIEKKRKLFLEKKTERRKKEKIRKKELRAKKILMKEDLGPSKKKLKRNKMSDSNCKVRVAIDLNFDHLMTEKDISKLCQQLQYCYSSNRRSSSPLQLFMTSLGGKTLKRLQEIGFYTNWDVNICNNSYLENFNKSEIIYLTSDSPNPISSLHDDKVYIIGGLVDHNHHKGLCYNKALELGIDHAHLPINQFVQMSSRRVLTVNHVFEILLKYCESEDWKEAFYSVIPKRKISNDNSISDTTNN